MQKEQQFEGMPVFLPLSLSVAYY